MLLKFTQGSILMSVTYDYVLVYQGGIYILNVDNNFLRISVTKNMKIMGGIVFLGWGVGGFLSQLVRDRNEVV